MFNGENAIADNTFNAATAERKVCLITVIGRIMTYMNYPVVNRKLGNTANSVEDTL